jgi:DUF438 domain-containing protein
MNKERQLLEREQVLLDRAREQLDREREQLDEERQAFATEKKEFQKKKEKDRQEIASREVDLCEERAKLKAIHKEREAMLIRLALYEAQLGASPSTIFLETGDTIAKRH